MRKADPERWAEKRSEILQAAGRCFVREGLRGATISMICAEAGISPGHLYYYFKNKEEIVRAMAEARLEYANELIRYITESNDPIASLIGQLGAVKSHAARDNQSLIFDMLAEAARNPDVASILVAQSSGLRALLARVLRQGQERGQVDPALDPDIAAALLMGVVDAFGAVAVRYPALDPEKIADHLKTLFLKFLAPQPPPTPDQRPKL